MISASTAILVLLIIHLVSGLLSTKSIRKLEIRELSPRLLAKKQKQKRHIITTTEGLDDYLDESNDLFRKRGGNDIDYPARQRALYIEGDTQSIGSPEMQNMTHPVVQLLHERRKSGKTAEADGLKVALSIEGGGMRGCVSAGMVAAIYYLGLENSIDVVYGSSAGGVIGSYFVTRQLQWFGPEIYYDSLPTAGRKFIQAKRLLRALGVGLLNPLLWKDFITKPRFGKPVLNLDYLLKTTMQEAKPLDWEKFASQQAKIPMKIVSSNLQDEKAMVMDMEKGDFSTLSELAKCMHASCLLPGIAGPMMNRDNSSGEYVLGNNKKGVIPLADALLYEPMPFRSAIEEGATHVVVLRTRPDGTDVTGKSSLFERMIFNRFLKRKNKLPKILSYLKKGLHKMQYGRDVIILNEMAKDTDRDYNDTSKPHVVTVALPPGSPEVSRLETDRAAIFNGVRLGFARAYDALVEDPSKRGQGENIAKEYFPDKILDYDPLLIDNSTPGSAFEVYLQQLGEDPDDWKVRASYLKAQSEIAQ